MTMVELRMGAIRRRRGLALLGMTLVVGGLGLLGSAVRISRAEPQSIKSAPAASAGDLKTSNADADTPPRQVTVIAILVEPGKSGGTPDPRLSRIKPQLRKLIPDGHGLRLLDVRSDRLSVDETLKCDLGKGRSARVTLIAPDDSEGKIKLRCELLDGKNRLSASDVSTPLNQLFFCEHSFEGGKKILIGVGAR
jgi:hypothetical protein